MVLTILQLFVNGEPVNAKRFVFLNTFLPTNISYCSTESQIVGEASIVQIH